MDEDESPQLPEGRYYRVTLAYDVLVEAEPDERLTEIAARAVEQEELRTGTSYIVIAIDGVPLHEGQEGNANR